jgi:phage gp46-like protein
MDAEITISGGQASLNLSEGDERFNALYLSLAIPRGSFPFAPGFGSRIREVKKLTEEGRLTVVSYAIAATKWLIDSGRAKVVTVESERDVSDVSRLNVVCRVIWSDNETQVYRFYHEVV